MKFSDRELNSLRRAFDKLPVLNTSKLEFKTIKDILFRLDKEALIQLKNSNIKWVSHLADMKLNGGLGESINESNSKINAQQKWTLTVDGKVVKTFDSKRAAVIAQNKITQTSDNWKSVSIELKESINEASTEQINTKLNLKVKQHLDVYLKGKTPSSAEFHHTIALILSEALTDSNFHSESKKVLSMFPKANSSRYKGTEMEGVIRKEGRVISKWAEWDGYDIINAFVYYVSMTIGRPVGEKIAKLKESTSAKSKINKIIIEEVKRLKFPWAYKNESHTASHPNAALLDRIGDKLAKMEERGKEDTAEYKALDKKYKELEKKTNESVNESFENPLEGFPQVYKNLLKKLQRSNDMGERYMLIQKMNVIRKKLKLKPLTSESVNEAKSTKKGDTYYVDTDFVNLSKKGGNLKHLGMGDFAVDVYGGKTISFHRVSEKIPGFSGRTHRVVGNGDDFKKLTKLMGIKSESVVKESEPCWDDYKQIGMKEKDGKKVPNCVPESKQPIKETITKEQKFKIYHKLKKGNVINIKYRSMAGTTEVELTVVKDKTLVGKSRSERITLSSKKGYKYYLYNRYGDISLAVGESAAQILDITESVNEIASRTAVEIGALTGANREFIQNFMDKHKLDPEKVYNFVKKGKYAERADFITAVAGRDGNQIQKKLIQQLKLKESTSAKSKINKIIIEEVRRLKESKYPLYHTSFTSAADAARNFAMSKGYKVNEEDWQTEVALGGKNLRSRPSTGKTTKFSVGLSRNGKPEKNKQLHFQVYGLESGNYELNAYVS